MFPDELSGCMFETRSSNLNFRIHDCSSKELFDIQATAECGSALKRLGDVIRTYSEMHHTDRHSEQLNHSASSAKWLSVPL